MCRCKGASHYGLSADRKRRSQEGECTDSTSELTIATLPNDGPTSAAVALLSDDPGLVNPAFDPSMEDNSQSGSSTSLSARSSTKKSECELAHGCSVLHDVTLRFSAERENYRGCVYIQNDRFSSHSYIVSQLKHTPAVYVQTYSKTCRPCILPKTYIPVVHSTSNTVFVLANTLW